MKAWRTARQRERHSCHGPIIVAGHCAANTQRMGQTAERLVRVHPPSYSRLALPTAVAYRGDRYGVEVLLNKFRMKFFCMICSAFLKICTEYFLKFAISRCWHRTRTVCAWNGACSPARLVLRPCFCPLVPCQRIWFVILPRPVKGTWLANITCCQFSKDHLPRCMLLSCNFRLACLILLHMYFLTRLCLSSWFHMVHATRLVFIPSTDLPCFL